MTPRGVGLKRSRCREWVQQSSGGNHTTLHCQCDSLAGICGHDEDGGGIITVFVCVLRCE